ncbi:hypothetical protein LCER1_G009347 [Lachnellula cervina]|uniref:Uncharacterized protein n=1 Tax=Lachnellula cervina TaxID=1316786 RepID=A0A7D8Z3N3_9HELO|nr:hypothetical protein LCER1_G009347 [Lachnellula cervina]
MALEIKSYASLALATIPDLGESNWIRIINALINKSYLYRKIIDGTLVRLGERIGSETLVALQICKDKWEELQIQERSTLEGKVFLVARTFMAKKGKVTFDEVEEDDLKLLFSELKERFKPQGVADFYKL